MGPLFIAPCERTSALFELERSPGPRIVQRQPLAKPPLAPCVLDLENDRVVYLHKDGHRLVVVRGISHAETSEASHIALPKGHEVEVLALRHGVLFLGGKCDGDLLGAVDLESPSPAWKSVVAPPGLRKHGKRVDGVHFVGDRMIVVDDFVVPKYLVEYDATNPRAPTLLGAWSMPWHTTYERVYATALNERALALLSSGINHGQSSTHLSLLDPTSLEESAVLQLSSRETEGLRTELRGLDALGSLVLLAAGPHGVGVLDCRAVMPEAVKDRARRRVSVVMKEERKGRDLDPPRGREFKLDAVRFVPVTEGCVWRVIALSSDLAVAVISGGTTFRSVLVSLR